MRRLLCINVNDPSLRPRLATVDDYEQVADCMGAFRDFLGDSEPATARLAVGAYHALAEGLAEYVIIGDPAHSYAQLRYIWSAWHLADLCWIEDVFISESYRGRGLGRTLMQFIENRARARGCHRLQLDANERNEPGTRLYEASGMTCTSSWWDGGRDLYWTKVFD